MDPASLHHPILRRDFLRVIGLSLFTLVSGDLLSGCGGGDSSPGNNTNSTIQTQAVQGTVNRSEIGGNGLSILSPYQAQATVEQNGSFRSLASREATQLLAAVDNAGKLRGLGISFPASPTLVTFDATSTALALVMLSPGILTLDPAKSAERIQQIKGLSAFGRRDT